MTTIPTVGQTITVEGRTATVVAVRNYPGLTVVQAATPGRGLRVEGSLYTIAIEN